MANVAANWCKHKIGQYWELARDTSADIGLLLIIQAGVQGDDAIQDHATLSALLAATNDEATFTNYARKIIPGPSITIDNATNLVSMSATGPFTWTAAGAAGGGGAGNNTLVRACFYYDPTPGTSTDATRLPLTYHDIFAITDGNDLVITPHTDGILRARNP